MAPSILLLAILYTVLVSARAQTRLNQDDGRTSDLALSFASGGCTSNPCEVSTSNYAHVDGWVDATQLFAAIPGSLVEAEIEPVGFNLTARVECSLEGITPKNGLAAGLGKFWLVTSFEPGCQPTQMAEFAASNGAAGLIVAARSCINGFGVGGTFPEPFRTECAESYDTGVYARSQIEAEVYTDYNSTVNIPVVVVSRYEAYSLRECIDGNAAFTDASCSPGSSIRARFQWNRKAQFGDKVELWDSLANERTTASMFTNTFLRLVFEDLLRLSFVPSYFIEQRVCGGGSCTKECSGGYCTRELSPSYEMEGGADVLEEMQRRFCIWSAISSLNNKIRWIDYIDAFESVCYGLGTAYGGCGSALAGREIGLNLSTITSCAFSLPLFLDEMDDSRRTNLPGSERSIVFNDKIIYRDTDAGNELLEFNTIMAPICQARGSESSTPLIARACSCSAEIDPIPDFDTYNECFIRVVEEPGPPDDTPTIAALAALAVVGILFSGAAFYRTRNYRKISDEEKLFTREEALKMAQEFADQIVKDQNGQVGAVKEDGMFAKEAQG